MSFLKACFSSVLLVFKEIANNRSLQIIQILKDVNINCLERHIDTVTPYILSQQNAPFKSYTSFLFLVSVNDGHKCNCHKPLKGTQHYLIQAAGLPVPG